MREGYVNLRMEKKREHMKVGCEEETSSSKRPELVAIVLVLRDTLVTKPMLYLRDNQALLKAVKRWQRRRRKGNVSRSTRHRHFIGSYRESPKRYNSRSSDVSGQKESALRRTCRRRS